MRAMLTLHSDAQMGPRRGWGCGSSGGHAGKGKGRAGSEVADGLVQAKALIMERLSRAVQLQQQSAERVRCMASLFSREIRSA